MLHLSTLQSKSNLISEVLSQTGFRWVASKNVCVGTTRADEEDLLEAGASPRPLLRGTRITFKSLAFLSAELSPGGIYFTNALDESSPPRSPDSVLMCSKKRSQFSSSPVNRLATAGPLSPLNRQTLQTPFENFRFVRKSLPITFVNASTVRMHWLK